LKIESEVIEITQIALEGEFTRTHYQSVPGFVHTLSHRREGRSHHKSGEAEDATSQASRANHEKIGDRDEGLLD
jgi:hypothetical protein